MNSERIATLARVAEPLHQAAEIYESIRSKLVPLRELESGILDLAKSAGEHLEQAAITLEATKSGIPFSDALAAHAPNINPKMADRFRRFSKGQITDPRQYYLGFVDEKPPPEKPKNEVKKAKAEDWEVAFAALAKFEEYFDPENWQQDHVELVIDRLNRLLRRAGDVEAHK